TKYSGQSSAEKLTALRAELAKSNADFMVLSALDDIAWLYNIRGNDVAYNPVVIAYSLVSNNNATLFIDTEKLTAETKQYLDSQGVITAPYLDIYTTLNAIPHGKSVVIDGAKLNQSLNEAIPLNTPRRNQMSLVFKLKSIKNETEAAGIRWAMVKDGVALTRFFMWLEANLDSGKLTEMSIAEKLYEFRKMQE
ncbi:aminopeptidase P family N-terminal domain-containing protein, partial [bacterium]|nr:aminopeptidase P family N-terminal domain-containing protein [bacterium]